MLVVQISHVGSFLQLQQNLQTIPTTSLLQPPILSHQTTDMVDIIIKIIFNLAQ